MDIHNSRASEFGGRVPLPFARSQPGRSEGDGFAGGWSPGLMTFTSVDFGLFSNRDLCRLCQFEQVSFFFSLGMMYI